MRLGTLDCHFPQSTKVGTILWNETPLHVPCSAELCDGPGSRRAPWARARAKAIQIRDGCPLRAMKHRKAAMKASDVRSDSFQIECLHSERNKNAHVCLCKSRFEDHAILDKKGTGVVHSNFLKDSCHTLQTELSHHLWLWSHSLAPTCHTLMCDRSDCLPEIDHMKPATEDVNNRVGPTCNKRNV